MGEEDARTDGRAGGRLGGRVAETPSVGALASAAAEWPLPHVRQIEKRCTGRRL